MSDTKPEHPKHLPDREYQEGQDAAIANMKAKGQLPPVVNPYTPNTPEFNRWEAGYLDTEFEG